MKKLLELLAIPKQSGDFGVEIEVEGRNLPNIDDMYWKSVADHSLRGGMEYVFKKPVALKAVPALIKRLNDQFKAVGADPEFTFRTSVHVHMNAQSLTYEQLLNTIYIYLLLEEPLMNFCGEERKANRFCLRIRDAEQAMDVFTNLFRGADELTLKKIPNNKMRYAAINIEALIKYGSLEFRAMQGNMDGERITKWCTALDKIKKFACKYNNPSEIYNFYIENEAQNFINAVLEELSPEFMDRDAIKGIQQGFSLSLELPFEFSNRKNKKEVARGAFENIVDDVGADIRQDIQAARPADRPVRFDDLPMPAAPMRWGQAVAAARPMNIENIQAMQDAMRIQPLRG